MSLSYNILIIKDDSKSTLELKNIVLEATPKYSINKSGVSFDETINSQHLSSEKNYALSTFKNFLLIADENHNVSEKIIDKFRSILRVELSDTARVELFEYWEDGQLKRKFSSGYDAHAKAAEQLKGVIPDDAYQEMTRGDFDIGETYWFEKNGTSTASVLDDYGVNENKLWDISWDIYSYKN